MGKKDLGLVHIYCGEGKGKTTCSVGLTVRASAYGHKVLFMQFLKPGTSSELKALRTLPGVTVVNTTPTKKFTFMMTDEEKAEVRERNAKEFLEVVEQAKREEVNHAIYRAMQCSRYAMGVGENLCFGVLGRVGIAIECYCFDYHEQ